MPADRGDAFGEALDSLADIISFGIAPALLGKGPIGFALVTARLELRMDGTLAWLFALGGTYW